MSNDIHPDSSDTDAYGSDMDPFMEMIDIDSEYNCSLAGQAQQAVTGYKASSMG